MSEVVTADLSKFGWTELREASRLLSALIDSHMEGCGLVDGITINMNTSSGYVFLSDEEYNVAMINDETGKLEKFWNCPQCGNEGFLSDFPFDRHNGFCSEQCEKEND